MEIKDTTINVLGTTYTIKFLDKEDDSFLKENDVYGYCDRTSKSIVVMIKPKTSTLDDYEFIYKQTLRHEITHAFMNESGLADSWMHVSLGHDETIIDWFAIQSPKMYKVFSKLGIL